ncbi:MAG: DNA-directed RNA polymerase subunit D [Candidatus Pacearchaeota archaeon]
MDLKIIDKGEDWIKIKVSGINYTLANAIRRSSYEIDIPAIDEIEVHKNDSVLYDEILANRLGLIPLIPSRDLKRKEECSCKGKGCKSCTLKLKLEAKGKGMVYSDKLVGEAEALFKDIPIVWLEEDQEIKIIADVTLGKAIDHAKYQAGLVIFNPCYYLSNFDEKFIENNEKIKNIIEKFKIPLKKGVEIDEKQFEILDWIRENYKESKIKLEISDKDFIFYIETYSYLKPIEIFIKSLEALEENLNKLNKILK